MAFSRILNPDRFAQTIVFSYENVSTTSVVINHVVNGFSDDNSFTIIATVNGVVKIYNVGLTSPAVEETNAYSVTAAIFAPV